MRIVKQITTGVVVCMFLFVSQAMQAQGTDPIIAVQQKLNEGIILAKLDGNGDIVTAGSVLTLKKDSLQMCATPNSGAPVNAGAPANTYKNGKLSAGMFMWKLGLGISKIDPNTIPQRQLLPGEKFWVVNYTVKKNGVVLKLWTDADSNNVRYWGWLEIPFAKNQVPPADDVMKTLAEVLDADTPAQAAPAAQSAPPQSVPVSDAGPGVDSSNSALGKYVERGKSSNYIELANNGVFFLFQDGKMYNGNYTVEGVALILSSPHIKGNPAFHIIGNTIKYDVDGTVYEKPFRATAAPEPPPVPAAPEAPPEPAMAPIPPPPPPPAAPKTIALGQTKDQVAAILGQPDKIANLGSKEIDYYSDMKVIFANGKVTDIQ
jgi:hypothetical protein